MLLKRFLASLTAIVALLGGVVNAQGPMDPVGATFEPQTSSVGAGQNLEFVSDQLMNYDMQMFAPVDYNMLSDEPKPPTGVFFTYDRTTGGLTAPESTTVFGQGAPNFNHTVWGNRFEFGFMTEDDCGWTATINRMEGSQFIGGRTENMDTPMQMAAKFQSYELNRVFRQRLRNGGYFEPYIGARYAYVQDETRQDIFTDAFGLNDPLITDTGRFLQESQNNLFGGTLGARMFRQTGRWTVSGNVATFLAYNKQTYYASDVIFDEDFSAGIVVERAKEGSTFVPVGECRIDLAYHLTRDIAFRVGGQVQYFFEGLDRANSLPTLFNPNSIQSGVLPFNPLVSVEDQDMAVFTATFGLEWKR